MTNSAQAPVIIEYVTKNNIFGIKMMMKSGLENIMYFEIPRAPSETTFHQNFLAKNGNFES